jgi:hypothetical protein
LRAAAPAGYALDDLGVVDFEQHHGIERRSDGRQHDRERFGLSQVARKAVQNESVCGITLGQAFANDSQHDLVGNEVAGVHGGLGAPAVLGPAGQSAAQQIAGGDLGDAIARDETLGLGSFPRTRGPHKHDTHPGNSTHRRPPGQTSPRGHVAGALESVAALVLAGLGVAASPAD